MPVNIVSRVAARAVIPAALAAGSLSLAATAAGACASSAACGGGPFPVAAPRACTTPDCIKGVPPAAAVMGCTDPRCVRGTQPTAVPWPGGPHRAGRHQLPAAEPQRDGLRQRLLTRHARRPGISSPGSALPARPHAPEEHIARSRPLAIALRLCRRTLGRRPSRPLSADQAPAAERGQIIGVTDGRIADSALT